MTLNDYRKAEFMSVLVVGSVALDTVTTPFGRREEVLGGSASYFSCAASAFSRVRLVGVVGEDFPVECEKFLGRFGVDLTGLEKLGGKTFRWEGRYGEDVNECDTLSTCLNVFEDFHPRLPEAFRTVPFLFLANIDPQLQLEVLGQMKGPRFVACDTMNFWIEKERDTLLRLMRQTDLLILNDSEARLLSGQVNLVKAAKAIQKMGCPRVIIKKGENGSLMLSEDGVFSAPAYPLEVVRDPTGAGDTFAGGLMGYLAKTGLVTPTRLRRALLFGTVMASFCVEHFGQEGLVGLTRDAVDRRFRELKRTMLP